MSKHELAQIDHTGDTKLIWDSDNQDEVDNARETFQKLSKKGYTAFAVKGKGEKGTKLKEFDPTEERIIMVPPLVGG